MKLKYLIPLPLLILYMESRAQGGLPWPIEPTGQTHALGNSFGEYQQYGEDEPYFHPGIDIREGPSPDGPWVVASWQGVPHISYFGTLYNGIEMEDLVTGERDLRLSYWHLDRATIPQDVIIADLLEVPLVQGTRLGKLVPWTSCDYNHLHFEMEVRGDLSTDYIRHNPLASLTPAQDIDGPTVDSTWFCVNNSRTFFPRPAFDERWVLCGDVDIIATAHDMIRPDANFSGTASVGIYKITYQVDEILGAHDIPETPLWEFLTLPDTNMYIGASAVYKQTPPCSSNSDYCATEAYYYIVTNTKDGELDEPNGFWDIDALDPAGQREFPNGKYRVTIRAYDLGSKSVGTLEETVIIDCDADFGDAADGPYCSFLKRDGARHLNPNGFYEWLGDLGKFTSGGCVPGLPEVDREHDSWQIDLDSPNDPPKRDDGVIDAGNPITILLSTSGLGTERYSSNPDSALHFQGWRDFNCNGDWDDPGEHLYWLSAKPVEPDGPEIVINGKDFVVNPALDWGGASCRKYKIKYQTPPPSPDERATTCFDRFRLCYGPLDCSTYTGMALYGEVEDYGGGGGVKIGKTHKVPQGHYTIVPIFIENTALTMGGFDFLIAYDAAALTAVEVRPGGMLDSCGWEYFTYRLGAQGNCGSGCPSGMLRIVAVAETNNGNNHPTCYGPPDTDPHELATMEFFVSNDRTFECQYVPIKFFWNDCGDNTVSNTLGDVTYISNHVYDFEGNDITGEPQFGGHWYLGNCQNPDTTKPSPVPLINYQYGGVDIVCAESLDVRGDINLNGIANEIGDAAVFTNYFLFGLSAFVINEEGQIAASDVNADGIPLTVGDLTYLIRVIIGDALPLPKLRPNADKAQVIAVANHTAVTVSINSETDIGAGYFVFQHPGYRIGEPHLIDGGSAMTLKYNDQDGILRVLVFSMEKGKRISSGAENIFVIPIEGEGDIDITETQLSDYYGDMITVTNAKNSVLPKEFVLYQNYPNPFNLATQIIYELPIASHVKIEIYNMAGQKVVTLLDSEEPAGVRKATWNGKDRLGNEVSSGVYFYTIKADDFAASKKMIMLK